jgi:pimeloyl-ACP methyl ester carboxylesterase
MFELAVRHPERALALFAVAGVPGDTFSTMLAPLRLPRFAARALAVNLSRGLSLVGGALTPLTTRLPVGPRGIDLLTRTGFMFPLPDPELAALAVAEFLTTPVDWYAHLALRSSRHARVSLSGITLPAVFVAGTFDLMAGARDMASAAARIEGATYVELRGSHFLQMEQPDRVHALLLDLVARVS